MDGFALILVFAVLVVVVGVFGLMFKLASALVRGLFGGSPAAGWMEYHVCRARGCGHDNRPGARYCAQCGRKLEAGSRERR
jgi:hypothetical protein